MAMFTWRRFQNPGQRSRQLCQFTPAKESMHLSTLSKGYASYHYIVQSPVVNAEACCTIFLCYEYYWWRPWALWWFYNTSLEYLVYFSCLYISFSQWWSCRRMSYWIDISCVVPCQFFPNHLDIWSKVLQVSFFLETVKFPLLTNGFLKFPWTVVFCLLGVCLFSFYSCVGLLVCCWLTCSLHSKKTGQFLHKLTYVPTKITSHSLSIWFIVESRLRSTLCQLFVL